MSRPKRHKPTHSDGRPLKITFGKMRGMGLRGILIYCHCGHNVALSADHWPGDVRLSDLEPRLVCEACGSRGGEVRPDFETGDGRGAILGQGRPGVRRRPGP